MSKRNFFGKKSKSDGQPQSPPERALDAIKADYQQICSHVGEEQFRMKTSEIRVAQLNQRLAELHNEYNRAEAKAKASKDSGNGIPAEGGAVESKNPASNA